MKKFFPVSRPSITELERSYVSRAVASGWVSSIGEFIDQFESRFADFCGTKYAVSVGNGTVALQLALKALNIGPGDEVIVPDLSFIATANAVLHAGAMPVFADIHPETLGLDSSDLKRVLTVNTKAIIPVHLYGHPADMASVNRFARDHGLHVIEDAAEAHGAQIGEDRVGSLSDCGIFSFYGNKSLTTGEGGMITTDDEALMERCRLLRDHAMSKTKRYWHIEAGYNFRLSNLHAALGCAQLDRADELLSARRRIFEWYHDRLADVPGITMNRRCEWATPSYWMVCVEFDEMDENRREEVMTALRGSGVDTRPYFYPMSDMPYFKSANTPVAHRIAPSGMNLPTYIDLTEEDVDYISTCVKMSWEPSLVG